MGVVIGFTFPTPHDNAVAAIVDGKLVFASEEERYTRHKHSFDEPPSRSLMEAIRYLAKFGMGPEDVDAFAINWDPRLYPLRARFKDFVQQLSMPIAGIPGDPLSAGRILISGTFRLFDFVKVARFFLARVYKKLGAELPSKARVYAVPHHLTHAAAAYYFSGFSSSTVLTMDANGERDSTVVWKVDNGDFEKIGSVRAEEGSVGQLYEEISSKLKLGALEGAGKVMGLAPYGKHDERISSRFEELTVHNVPDRPYVFAERFRAKSHGMDAARLNKMYSRTADFLTGDLDLNWNPKTELVQPIADLAWELQKFTERMVIQTAEWAKEETGESKIALGGGVALNAKANMTLHYSGMYEDMFIFPAANDAGGPVGAAAYVYEHVLGEKMKHGRLDNVYLGREYDSQLIESLVVDGKWNSEYIGDDVARVADLVSKGQVVCWYKGRAELGPRALGNRSIVADPRREDTWRNVNKIKGREYWRPLAPSVLEEEKETYFKDPSNHRFMVLMFEMTTEGAKRVPAVCHVDMSSRPQMVSRETNSLWHELIRSFKDLSGEGLVVNTSFNLAGEPLVETPQEAIKSFALGGFDALFLQGWLIRKRP